MLLDLIFVLDKPTDESYLTNLLKKHRLRVNERRYGYLVSIHKSNKRKINEDRIVRSAQFRQDNHF
jgi:hypothetical protein